VVISIRLLTEQPISLHKLARSSQEMPHLGSEKTIRLKNIRKQQQAIRQAISILSKSVIDQDKTQELAKRLELTVREIERLCDQQNIAIADLSASSRQIYSWMKFLTLHHLELHLKVIQQINQIVAEILVDKRHLRPGFHSVPTVEVELVNSTSLYKVSRKQNTVLIEINEGFICADKEILTALVQSVLLGKSPAKTRIIRTFSLSEEYSEMLLKLDVIDKADSESSQGRFYDLDTVFEQVNHEYFANQMTKPRLSWSHLLTRRKLGHYEPARDRVVLSLSLDDQRVPEFVIEFVMYHELLGYNFRPGHFAG